MFHHSGDSRHVRLARFLIFLISLAPLLVPLPVRAVGPTIISITSTAGTVAGGTGLAISGTGFVAGATVTFGGSAAPAVTVVTSSVITCRTPPHTFGFVDVTVTNPDAAAATLPGAFVYTTGAVPVPAATTVTEFSSGIAASANPFDIVPGPNGTLWFAENTADKIGSITTGGAVTEYTIPTANSDPEGLAIGPDSNLWFVEKDGNKIGTIDPTNPGAGFREFSLPHAGSGPANITAGADGNLWFTEFNGTRIGKITPSGTITEFSTGLTASGQPLGIAAGPDGNVWFTEYAAFKVGKIAPTGAITEPAGVNGKPRSIAAGPDGNLWVTEDTSNKVARVTPAGAVTEFAAGGGPTGIAAGPDGGMWFTEFGGNRVGRVEPASGTVVEFSGGIAAGSKPQGIAAGPDGNVWFTEATGNKIGKLPLPPPTITGVNPTTGTVAGDTSVTIIGTGFSPDAAVTLGGKATIPLSRSVTQLVVRALPHAAGATDVAVVNGDRKAGTLAHGYTFTQVATSVNPAEQEFGPVGRSFSMASGPDGNLWFTEYDNDRIGKVTPAGVVTEFSNGIPAGSVPMSIAAGPDGNVWFSEYDGMQIGRINPFTATSLLPGIVQFTTTSRPGGIAAGPDGNLWFTEAGSIGRITPAGAITEFPVPFASGSPFEIAAGPDGNLWFTAAGSIGKITPTGVVTEYSSGITGNPEGITLGPDGNLWFTETVTDSIGKITPAGVVTEFPIPRANQFLGDIAAGPDGDMWFAEDSSSAIGKINPATATPTNPGIAEFPVTFGNLPDGIATGPDGNLWFSTSEGSHIVGVLFVAPPTVAAISPASGPANAAQPITITGMGFAPGSQVLVGGAACTDVTVVNPTTITCTAPAQPPGTVDVTVVIPGGIPGTKHGYTYGTPSPLPVVNRPGGESPDHPIRCRGHGAGAERQVRPIRCRPHDHDRGGTEPVRNGSRSRGKGGGREGNRLHAANDDAGA